MCVRACVRVVVVVVFFCLFFKHLYSNKYEKRPDRFLAVQDLCVCFTKGKVGIGSA